MKLKFMTKTMRNIKKGPNEWETSVSVTKAKTNISITHYIFQMFAKCFQSENSVILTTNSLVIVWHFFPWVNVCVIF